MDFPIPMLEKQSWKYNGRNSQCFMNGESSSWGQIKKALDDNNVSTLRNYEYTALFYEKGQYLLGPASISKTIIEEYKLDLKLLVFRVAIRKSSKDDSEYEKNIKIHLKFKENTGNKYISSDNISKFKKDIGDKVFEDCFDKHHKDVKKYFSPKGLGETNYTDEITKIVEGEIIDYLKKNISNVSVAPNILSKKFTSPKDVISEIQHIPSNTISTASSGQKNISEEIIERLAVPNGPIEILLIDYKRGDGTRPLEPVYDKLNSSSGKYMSIYIDGSSHFSEYPGVIRKIHQALNLSVAKKDKVNLLASDLSSMDENVVRFFQAHSHEKVIIILLDNIDLFSSKRSITSTVFRDNATHALIDEIRQSGKHKVKLVYSLCPNIDNELTEHQIKAELLFGEDDRIEIMSTNRPSILDIKNTYKVNDKYGGKEEVIDEFVDSMSNINQVKSPSLIYATASSFCFSSLVSFPLKNQSEVDEKDQFIESAKNIVYQNDMRGACELLWDTIEKNFCNNKCLQSYAIIIISLHDDGCTIAELGALLDFLKYKLESWSSMPYKDWENEKRHVYDSFKDNDFFPLLSSICRNEKKVFFIHKPIKNNLIKIWFLDDKWRALIRELFYEMSFRSLCEFKKTISDKSKQIEASEYAINFYVQLMASIVPEKMKAEPLIPLSNESESDDLLDELINRFERRDEISETQKYCLSLGYLFRRSIYSSNSDSKVFAADELRLNLIMRAWLPGWYISEELSLNPSSRKRTLPIRLPLAGAYRSAVDAAINQRRAKSNQIQMIESKEIFITSMTELDKEVEESERNQKSLYEYEKFLGERIMYSAASVDDISLREVGMQIHSNSVLNLSPEEQVYQLNDSSEVRKLRLKCYHRAGDIELGSIMAQNIVTSKIEKIKNHFSLTEKVKAKDFGKHLDEYEIYLDEYLKSAARYSDILALSGNYERCHSCFYLLSITDQRKIYNILTGEELLIPEIILKKEKYKEERCNEEIFKKIKKSLPGSILQRMSNTGSFDIGGMTENELKEIYSLLMGVTLKSEYKNPHRYIKVSLGKALKLIRNDETKNAIFKAIKFRINKWITKEHCPKGHYWSPCSTYSYSRFIARYWRMQHDLSSQDESIFSLDEKFIERRFLKPANSIEVCKSNVLSNLIEEKIKIFAKNISNSNSLVNSNFVADNFLELAMWVRVNALNGFTSRYVNDSWKEDWNYFVKTAKSVARRGNLSTVTYLRLQLEEVRYYWQSCSLEDNKDHAATAIKILNHVVLISKKRQLASYEIAARLLRFEISMFVDASNYKDESDLTNAIRLMNDTGCNHRQWEVEVLTNACKHDRKSKPCLYIGA